MDEQIYSGFRNYLKYGRFPRNFPSTKSNFRREAKKYHVNKKGVLLRGTNLLVVRKSERKKLFKEMHQHTGNCYHDVMFIVMRERQVLEPNPK